MTTSSKGLSFDFNDPSEAYKMLNPSDETGRGENSIMITDLDGTLTGTENSVTAAKGVYFMVCQARHLQNSHRMEPHRFAV